MAASMDKWNGKVAVVTGSSSGIGAAIAEILVDHGLKVVGLARRVEKTAELAKKLENKKGKLYALKTDLTEECDVLKAFEWIKINLGSVHILVNNAGCAMANANLINGDTDLWRKTLDLNVLGLCVVTRETVKCMRENNVDGHIININSVGGHKVPICPKFNVYSASKFAVTALTETFRQELNSVGGKIKITSISPGTVKTEFMKASGVYDGNVVENIVTSFPVLNTKDVADAAVYVLSTPSHVQVYELIISAVGQIF